jgi:hypothetical protein
VAKVPGSETSWTNTGLRPGDKFRYEVATRGGGWQSGPSPVATVSTLAPSPVGLKVASTYTTATLTWKPSPLGPAPDNYVVYNGTKRLATLDGATTSYVQRGNLEGVVYKYTVIAEWGTIKSEPSALDFGMVRSAALDNIFNTKVTPTSIPSGGNGATIGTPFSEPWYFTPKCTENACVITGDVFLPTYRNKHFSFNVKLTESGANYVGTVTVKFAKCSGTQTSDTVDVTLSPDARYISSGFWDHWSGTIVATMPYTSLGNGSYCPTQSWDFKVSGDI